jgi:hypothetical protein
MLNGSMHFAVPLHRYKVKQECCIKPEKKFEWLKTGAERRSLLYTGTIAPGGPVCPCVTK